MPLAHPTAFVGLDLLHDSDLGVHSFARHLGEGLPVDRARLVVAGMRGVLEGRPALTAEALAAFPALDLGAAFDGYDVVAALADAAGATGEQISQARAAAAHDLARSAWTVGPAAGLPGLRRILAAHGVQLAATVPGPVGVPELLDAIGMPDLPWVVVTPDRCRDWWSEAVRPAPDANRSDAVPLAPGDHLAVAARPADLVAPAAAGVATGLVDRFGRAGDDPTATWTAGDLTGLLPAITERLERR